LALAGTLADLTARQDDLRHRAEKIEVLVEAARAQADTSRTSAELKEQEAAQAAARLTAALGEGFALPDALRVLRSLDRTLASLSEHAAAAAETRQALALAAQRTAAEVEASPFADVAEARAALLGDAARRAAAQRIEAHDRQLMAVQDTLGDPLLADLPADRPDVDAANAAVSDAQRGKDLAVARRTRVHAASERIDEVARQHAGLLARLLPLESDANLHEAVANRCAGRASPKVSLQRWVLATYLEAICEHANRRLITMTAGRYQLRVERESAHGAAKAGLDLWVHDAHTATTRPVSSLSGGETFQASLALALGVADSVEARTGGVRLDALFVDEGFGTLDPESLELALDELDGLREGGRMVGLISHVAALRERIRVGIEVTPTDAGSTLRVGDIAAA
ncbi:MAG: ATPase involved in repair, partial [Acidimicrobiales bacterium]|nr:ATPase involved in repair [Acidimicrobiales bacterium]